MRLTNTKWVSVAKPKKPPTDVIGFQKEGLIEQLLHNSVYMPDSGLIVGLTKALKRLSKTDLENLLMVVNLKQDNSFSTGHDVGKQALNGVK